MPKQMLTPTDLRTLVDIGFAYGYSKGYEFGWCDGDEGILYQANTRKMFEQEYKDLLKKIAKEYANANDPKGS